jgi:tartrate dehydrogenase/decarboxylase/D-malate dehydrogenase
MSEGDARTYCIAVIPGDGIGREVVPPAVAVLEQIGKKFEIRFDFRTYEWGSDYYLNHGRMMPPNALDLLRTTDAILLGAIGHPDIRDNITLNGLLLPIRRAFDQFVNLRPAVLYPGVKSPLAGYDSRKIDMVIVRENTEGEYAQVGGLVHDGHPGELAVQASVFTRHGIERVVRFAFDLAAQPGRKKRVTSITKANAQAFGMGLWDRVFEEVKQEYPQIHTESLLVDAATIHFVRRPESFDVVVASNLFGDILSDLSAALTGSIGLAPSANIDPLRRFPSMFEPVHGSAPDIAGRGIANPMATFLACVMMLDHLNLRAAARSLENAVAEILSEGQLCTPDLGGNSSTQEVAEELIRKLESIELAMHKGAKSA